MRNKNLFFTLKWPLFGIFLLIAFSACEKKENPFPDHVGGQIFQGTKIVNVKCSGCHGALGGGGMSAPGLIKAAKDQSPEAFSETVLKGRGGMPAFDGVLKEDDVLQVIDWLQKLPN